MTPRVQALLEHASEAAQYSLDGHFVTAVQTLISEPDGAET